jgi:hypothetical protein
MEVCVEFNSRQKIVNYARIKVSNEKRSRTRTANQNQSYSESRHQHLKSTTTTEYKNPLLNSNIIDITILTALPCTMKPRIMQRTHADKGSHQTSSYPIRIRGNATINLKLQQHRYHCDNINSWSVHNIDHSRGNPKRCVVPPHLGPTHTPISTNNNKRTILSVLRKHHNSFKRFNGSSLRGGTTAIDVSAP